MVIINVTYHTKPGCRDKFVNAIVNEHIAEETRREAGNIEYRFSVPIGCEDTVALLEKWEGKEFLPAHGKQPKFLRLQELKAEFVDSTELERYSAEATK